MSGPRTWRRPFCSSRASALRLDRIENLIDLIPLERDHEVRNRMFDVRREAMGANPSLDPGLDGLIAWLSDDDPGLICNVLLLLPRNGERKYLPLAERYRAHPNEFVRRNAEYAWKYMGGSG